MQAILEKAQNEFSCHPLFFRYCECLRFQVWSWGGTADSSKSEPGGTATPEDCAPGPGHYVPRSQQNTFLGGRSHFQFQNAGDILS